MKLLDFMNLQKRTLLCRICTNSIKSENAMPCSCDHAFHVECLKSWIKEHKSESQCVCPTDSCRRTFTAFSVRKCIGGPVLQNISLTVDSQCPICCEDIQPPVATPESCNHHFCLSCLTEWARIRHECPLDRGPFEIMLLSSYIGGPIIERRCAPPVLQPPSDVEDTTACEICHSQEDEAYLLLCDSCDKGYHTYCLPNPLSEIPDGDWFCPVCESELEHAEQEVSGDDFPRPRRSSRSRRRMSFADYSAEETSSLGENADEDEEQDENSHSYLHYLSTESQNRLARIAARRHRGTGLLRNLIEQLSERVEMEEQQRRRNRRQSQRRRVRLAETISSPAPLDPPVQPSTSSPLQPATTTQNRRFPVRCRKRRLIVDCSSSSDSDDMRGTPATSRLPEPHSGLSECDSNADSLIASPILPPRRRLKSNPIQSGDEDASSSLSKPNDSAIFGPDRIYANDSRQDLFISLTNDPALDDTVDDIHATASKKPDERNSSAVKRKRRRAKRRRMTSKSSRVSRARRNVKKSRTSVSVKKSKKRQRVRLNSTQQSLQNSLSSLGSPAQPSTSHGTGRRNQRSDFRRPTPRLSITGTEVDYGLLSESEDDSGTKKSEQQSSPRPSASSSLGLLSRLEADQSSLFQFRTSNMHVNPDNSLSPVKSPPPQAKRTSNFLNHASAAKSGDPSSKLNGAAVNGTLGPKGRSRNDVTGSVEKGVNGHVSSDAPEPQVDPPKRPFSSSSTWTSGDAVRARKTLAAHLKVAHPSLTDSAARNRIVQRALSKVLAKKPIHVTDSKMKKLIDDYVNFYQRNPF
uniref:SAP30_Sin3_bdg domain-containing protein n=2 Tax=Mesocestoides corti TaxID=53468 RepID=A0A5K3EPW9_MESCO